jgi:ribosome biogenesis GTPase A
VVLLFGCLITSLPQVGKSAFISSLIGQSALAIYSSLAARDAAPSTTPHPQSVNMLHKKRIFKLIDTPGLSFIPPSEPASTDDSEIRIAKDVLLRNRGNISKIGDPLPAALYILSRAIMEDMVMLYNIPAVQPGDYDGFLTSLARKEGAVQRKVCMLILYAGPIYLLVNREQLIFREPLGPWFVIGRRVALHTTRYRRRLPGQMRPSKPH